MKNKKAIEKKLSIISFTVLFCFSSLLLSGCSKSSKITVDELTNKINNYFDGSIQIGDVKTKEIDDGKGFSYLGAGSGYSYYYYGEANDSMEVKEVSIMIPNWNGSYDFSDVETLENAMVDRSDAPTSEFVLSVCALYNVLGSFDTTGSFKEVENDIVNNASKSMNGWYFSIEAAAHEKSPKIKATYIG